MVELKLKMSVLTGIKKRLSDVVRPDTKPEESINVVDGSESKYIVQNIGYVELRKPGLNEICEQVNKLYLEAKKHAKRVSKSILTVTHDGILLESCNDGEAEPSFFKHRRIRYCGVDKQHRRVFHFNYQYGGRAECYHLHVILCKTKEDSKAIAKHLSEIFKKISVELHKKEKEDIDRHTQLTKELHRVKESVGTTESGKYGDSSLTSIEEDTDTFSVDQFSWSADTILQGDTQKG